MRCEVKNLKTIHYW